MSTDWRSLKWHLLSLTGTTWHRQWWHGSCWETLAYSFSVALDGGNSLGCCYSPLVLNGIDFIDCFYNFFFMNLMNIFSVYIINKIQQKLLPLACCIFVYKACVHYATINECTGIDVIWYSASHDIRKHHVCSVDRQRIQSRKHRYLCRQLLQYTIELKVQIAIVCLPGVVWSMQILLSLDSLLYGIIISACWAWESTGRGVVRPLRARDGSVKIKTANISSELGCTSESSQYSGEMGGSLIML